MKIWNTNKIAIKFNAMGPKSFLQKNRIMMFLNFWTFWFRFESVCDAEFRCMFALKLPRFFTRLYGDTKSAAVSKQTYLDSVESFLYCLCSSKIFYRQKLLKHESELLEQLCGKQICYSLPFDFLRFSGRNFWHAFLWKLFKTFRCMFFVIFGGKIQIG